MDKEIEVVSNSSLVRYLTRQNKFWLSCSGRVCDLERTSHYNEAVEQDLKCRASAVYNVPRYLVSAVLGAVLRVSDHCKKISLAYYRCFGSCLLADLPILPRNSAIAAKQRLTRTIAITRFGSELTSSVASLATPRSSAIPEI